MNKPTCLAVVAAIAAPLAFGDDYQYFSDYADFESANAALKAAAKVNSHSAASDCAALDGVYRTVAESQMTHLYTDKEGPTALILF
jgi:hypothetical protein